MARRKSPRIPDEMLDQLLSGASASTAFDPSWTAARNIHGTDHHNRLIYHGSAAGA